MGFAQGHIESNLKSFTLSVGKGDGVCWCWWGLKWVGTQKYKPRTRGVPAEHLAVSQKYLYAAGPDPALQLPEASVFFLLKQSPALLTLGDCLNKCSNGRT